LCVAAYVGEIITNVENQLVHSAQQIVPLQQCLIKLAFSVAGDGPNRADPSRSCGTVSIFIPAAGLPWSRIEHVR